MMMRKYFHEAGYNILIERHASHVEFHFNAVVGNGYEEKDADEFLLNEK